MVLSVVGASGDVFTTSTGLDGDFDILSKIWNFVLDMATRSSFVHLRDPSTDDTIGKPWFSLIGRRVDNHRSRGLIYKGHGQ